MANKARKLTKLGKLGKFANSACVIFLRIHSIRIFEQLPRVQLAS